MLHPSSRRSFLERLASGAVLLPTATLTKTFSTEIGSTDRYWNMVRQQFPFREERVPMNAANLCPSPRAVSERVSQLTHDIDTDCSFPNRAKFRGLLEEARTKVAKQLGVSPDEIALVRNTSEGNNTINNGLSLRGGDEIVLWDQNHPTNNVAWDVRAARYNLVVRRVSTPEHPEGPEQLIDVFSKALGPRTRVLAITHVSNVSGVRLPVRHLCDVAHRRGIAVHVDGAQTWGALRVNLRELDCDFYTASAHKWFLGPKEVGILYVREDRISEVWPNVVAPGWGSDIEPDIRGARKFESLGQRDDAALAAVGTTADFHRLIGSERIEARVQELSNALKTGLEELGLAVFTPRDPALSGGVCIAKVNPDQRSEIVDRLYDEYGIAGAPTGGLRLCPHIYNTMEHVERALQGVRALRESIV